MEESSFSFSDERRPPLPYVAGARFEIKRHKRLAPFDCGTQRDYQLPPVSSLSEPLLPSKIFAPARIEEPYDNYTPWRWTPSTHFAPQTITERYLMHRPRKTEPHDDDNAAHQLEITRRIRVKDGAYAQVVQCRVVGKQGLFVAKIFDPLYRSEDVKLDGPGSPVGLAESEWSCEAAAYERIQERGLDGRYTPRFEGCWSFDLPWELELWESTPGVEAPTHRAINITRNVRMLLMEFISGTSMAHTLMGGTYQQIPSDIRMGLLARIVEANTALQHINEPADHDKDVDNADGAGDKDQDLWSPFSIRHKKNGATRPQEHVEKWHVAVIDFSQSVVMDLPNAQVRLEGRLTPARPLPTNPMISIITGSWPIYDLRATPKWAGAAPGEKADWVDKDLRDQDARRAWMEGMWGQGSAKAHLYQPIDYTRYKR